MLLLPCRQRHGSVAAAVGRAPWRRRASRGRGWGRRSPDRGTASGLDEAHICRCVTWFAALVRGVLELWDFGCWCCWALRLQAERVQTSPLSRPQMALCTIQMSSLASFRLRFPPRWRPQRHLRQEDPTEVAPVALLAVEAVGRTHRRRRDRNHCARPLRRWRTRRALQHGRTCRDG